MIFCFNNAENWNMFFVVEIEAKKLHFDKSWESQRAKTNEWMNLCDVQQTNVLKYCSH